MLVQWLPFASLFTIWATHCYSSKENRIGHFLYGDTGLICTWNTLAGFSLDHGLYAKIWLSTITKGRKKIEGGSRHKRNTSAFLCIWSCQLAKLVTVHIICLTTPSVSAPSMWMWEGASDTISSTSSIVGEGRGFWNSDEWHTGRRMRASGLPSICSVHLSPQTDSFSGHQYKLVVSEPIFFSAWGQFLSFLCTTFLV